MSQREWKTQRCRGEDCDQEIIFLRTRKRKMIPVNVQPEDTEKFREVLHDEYDYVHGEHEPHHATCPNVGDFR